MSDRWRQAWCGLTTSPVPSGSLSKHWRSLGRHFVVVLLIVWLLCALGMALQLPDRTGPGFASTTLRFQLTWSESERSGILSFWRASAGMRFIAYMHLVVDALLFVPTYMTLLWSTVRLLRWAWMNKNEGVVSPAVARSVRFAGIATLLLGAADELENVLSLVWIHAQPATMPAFAGLGLSTVTWFKWVCAFATVLATGNLALQLVTSVGRASCGRLLREAILGLVHCLSVVYLNLFPIVSLLAGIALIGFVPQSRDILFRLGVESGATPLANLMHYGNLFWLGLGVLLWGASIWYSMRAVSRWTPGWTEQTPAFYQWLRRDLPRMAAYFGMLTASTLGTLFMSTIPAESVPTVRLPSMALAMFMALGALVMAEAVTSWLSASANRTKVFVEGYRSQRSAYRRARQAAALIAVFVAWTAIGGETTPFLQHFGWIRAPGDSAWHWRSDGITGYTVVHVTLFVIVFACYVLSQRAEARPHHHQYLIGAGLIFWWSAAIFADAGRPVLVFGVVLALAAAGLWFVVERRHFNWGQLRGMHAALVSQSPRTIALFLSRPDLSFSWLLVLASVEIIAVFSITPLSLGWAMGTLGIGFAALAMWSVLLCVLFVFLPKRLGLGNWCLLPIVWLVFFAQQSDHSLRAKAGTQEQPPALMRVQDHFSQWRKGLPDSDRSPVFIIAASGGGLRAAYWTGSLLAAMDDATCGSFGDHVFSVSGVSGGSLGLVSYLEQRRIWSGKPDPERCVPGRQREIQQLMQRDFLGPVAGSLLFAEAAQAFFPATYLKQERGNTLADAWSHAWRETFEPKAEVGKSMPIDLPLLDRFGVQQPGMPAVYLNATGAETGRRVIASNVHLGRIAADPLFSPVGTPAHLRLQTADISVVDAAVNSARFPFISPPGRVWGCSPKIVRGATSADHCDEGGYGVWGHLVDGGFFENSGLDTVMDMWRDLRADSITGRLREDLPPVFLIAISNDATYGTLCTGITPRSKDTVARTLAISDPSQSSGSDMVAPLSTLLNVRDGRSRLALRYAVNEMGCGRVLEWNFASVKGAAEEPPLGWVLSRQSVEAMDIGVKEYVAHFPFDTAWCAWETGPTRGVIGRHKVFDRDNCPPTTAQVNDFGNMRVKPP